MKILMLGRLSLSKLDAVSRKKETGLFQWVISLAIVVLVMYHELLSSKSGKGQNHHNILQCRLQGIGTNDHVCTNYQTNYVVAFAGNI